LPFITKSFLKLSNYLDGIKSSEAGYHNISSNEKLIEKRTLAKKILHPRYQKKDCKHKVLGPDFVKLKTERWTAVCCCFYKGTFSPLHQLLRV